MPTAEHLQHQQVMDTHSQSSNPSPLSPHFGGATSHVPSPPPAASGVRRHQSLTYGAGAGAKHQIPPSGLKRSGTLQAHVKHSHDHTPSPPNADEEYVGEDGSQPYYEDDPYTGLSSAPQQQQQSQGQYPASPIGRQSPWNNQGNEWRNAGGSGFSTGGGSGSAIDDVQRALSALEIASNTNQMYQTNTNSGSGGIFQSGQSSHPPRFNPNHPPPAQAPGTRTPNGGSNGGSSRQLNLVTDFDGRKTPLSQGIQGPVSASAYAPPIGGQAGQQQRPQGISEDERLQKDRGLTTRGSNPNLNYGYSQNQGKPGSGGIPNVPSIPPQYMNQQQQQGNAPRLGVTTSFTQNQGGQGAMPGGSSQSQQGFINTPIDVPSLIAAKGYNPSNFDIRPSFVRGTPLHRFVLNNLWSRPRLDSLLSSHILRTTSTNR
jgi:hypothetical protein